MREAVGVQTAVNNRSSWRGALRRVCAIRWVNRSARRGDRADSSGESESTSR
jgi:hypothetical protein